jgi:hypothetical protein
MDKSIDRLSKPLLTRIGKQGTTSFGFAQLVGGVFL